MGEPDLLVVCFAAFTAVFTMLAVLALVMRGLITLFPEPAAESIDPAVVAAVTAAASAAYPDSRIARIEETR
jgi:hypothetical protein